MRGQSGAGKTSLLRAGLQYTLKEKRKIPCVYWEARAAKPVEGLCHAIASELDIAQPANLRAFLAQTSSPVVLLIDQLEQLWQGVPDHQPVFDLFEEVFRRPAPHRLKIVVAFREHYDTAWLDFEEKAQILARKFLLKIFHPDLAVGIMATIMAEAQLTVDQALLSKYAYSVAGSSSGVTPVYIGIGVLVLSNWAEQAHRERLGLEDYTTAGGAVGVLSAHVQERLSELPEPDRPLLVKGLTLGLIDLVHDQRLSDGATCAEIARHAGMDSRRLDFCVQNYLVTANARILETVDGGADGEGPAPRYRLAHDRLVPVFRQLAGETLAVADRTKLTFDEQYARWLRTQSSRYLLSGPDLRLALKHRSFLISGDDSANRASFLARSSRRRNLQRLSVAGACSILLGIVPIGLQLNKATAAHSRLESWGLPPDLYERQRELESLTIREPRVNDLSWLNSATIHDFGIEPIDESTLGSLRGLRQLKHLRTLRLDLEDSKVLSLEDLPYLKELQSLDLRLVGAKYSSLIDLPQVRSLQTLRLYLNGSKVSSLAGLVKLTGLRNLTLELFGSDVTSLAELAQIKGLQNLTLGLRNQRSPR
jgi:hypothetical protein